MRPAPYPRRALLPVLLAVLLPVAAQAADTAAEPGEIPREISAELAQARTEVRVELAAARAELETGNLELGDSLRFGSSGKRSHAADPLPRAEITPRGDFLIEGTAVAIDARQRQQLLAYRRQVLDIALAGIDIGERSAQMALDAVDRGIFSLMLSAMTGGLERSLEKTIKASIEPGIVQICQRLPALHASQQHLAQSLPQFRPYATLEANDVEDCEKDVRREFALN